MCIPVQVGGVEVHWPGSAHSVLSAPCSSWPSSQLKVQTIPNGRAFTSETDEDRDGLQLIWMFVGISRAGHPNAKKEKKKNYEMLDQSTQSTKQTEIRTLCSEHRFMSKYCFHTSAGRYVFVPLSILQTLNGFSSLQIKACFTAEAAAGVWSQFSQRLAALGFQVSSSLWTHASNG